MARIPKEFAQVGRRTQIERMRAAARRALVAYGVQDAALRLVNHDYNTTFRVDTGRRRFALRINLNSRRSIEEVTGELSWVVALGDEPGLVVPEPVRSHDGRLVVLTEVDGLDHRVPAALSTWLEGPDLGDRVTADHATAMGRTIALLHRHGQQWQRPADARYRRINALLMDSPDHLGAGGIPWLDRGALELLATVRHRMDEVLAPVFDEDGHILHADVHPWNIKWQGDCLAIFDFDDCGIGVPLQDLAISAYYLRPKAGLEAALLDGYRQIRPIPEHSSEQFEALVASRNLMLLNDVSAWVTAGYDRFAADYAERSLRRLRHYLDTGNFSHDPPG